MRSKQYFTSIKNNPHEISTDPPTVLVNHARLDLYNKMIETGICYLRAGDSKGSLLVMPGFERIQYVLLHNGGVNCKLFKLKSKGSFQIWTKEALAKYGFKPTHAPYYVVLQFDNQNQIEIKRTPNLYENKYTYIAKIKSISEFLGYNIHEENKNIRL